MPYVAGKDAYAPLNQKIYGFSNISTADLLRNNDKAVAAHHAPLTLI